jgi:tRNA A-37 threonylcarbamoyl transferase component Bud32
MTHDTHALVGRATGGTRWQVLPEYQEVLLGPEGLRLDDWLRAGQARVVKHGPHRTVYRVTLPGLDFHLKQYRLPDVRAWLRELVRPSKARMEHDRALAVAARGMPTVTPLALGEPCRGTGDSFLITRTLQDVEPLGAFLQVVLPYWEPSRRTRLRQRLAVGLGRFLAGLHEAGIVHHDLHANNLLLHLDGHDQARLYLIDLHAVSLGAPLGWEASRANLVMLNRWFILRSSRSDRRRCWEAYSEARGLPRISPGGVSEGSPGRVREPGGGGRAQMGWSPGGAEPRPGRVSAAPPGLISELMPSQSPGSRTRPGLTSDAPPGLRPPGSQTRPGRPSDTPPGLTLEDSPGANRFPASLSRSNTSDLARDLERRTWLSNLGFWRSRDRRCLASNRHYARVRSGSVIGHAVRDLEPSLLAPFLADPDAPFGSPGVRLLKDSPSSTVAEFNLPGDGGPRPVIYKRFRITTWSDPWVALCRRPPALRSWVFGHGLRERCLPTPRPLAVLHRHWHGLPREGYLLMEKVPGAVELHRFVAGLADLKPGECRGVLRRLLEQVAALVRELHRCRLAHRDLKAANILVQDRADDLRLWLIDLVGVRRCRRLPRWRRVLDLGRLNASFLRSPLVTRTDRLRFLRSYLQCGLFGRERWKGWWRAADEATRAKVARNARSGRPLT